MRIAEGGWEVERSAKNNLGDCLGVECFFLWREYVEDADARSCCDVDGYRGFRRGCVSCGVADCQEYAGASKGETDVADGCRAEWFCVWGESPAVGNYTSGGAGYGVVEMSVGKSTV